GPGEAPFRETGEQTADHASLGHLSHGVHPDVPAVTGTLEHVGEPARDVMLLEHEDALAHLAQERGGGHAPHARADDQVVPWALAPLPAPRSVLAHAVVYHGVPLHSSMHSSIVLDRVGGL